MKVLPYIIVLGIGMYLGARGCNGVAHDAKYVQDNAPSVNLDSKGNK